MVDRLRQGCLLRELEKAEDNIKVLKCELREYRESGDKEMVSSIRGDLRYWKSEAKKWGQKYDELMNGSEDK